MNTNEFNENLTVNENTTDERDDKMVENLKENSCLNEDSMESLTKIKNSNVDDFIRAVHNTLANQEYLDHIMKIMNREDDPNAPVVNIIRGSIIRPSFIEYTTDDHMTTVSATFDLYGKLTSLIVIDEKHIKTYILTRTRECITEELYVDGVLSETLSYDVDEKGVMTCKDIEYHIENFKVSDD